ncbi:DUF4328 domain-containing protein [Nocardioides sp.]|uniref:DUF4328 domain-containing protein n=1 Tax=Nocardioides sp. TaxID=35761 RepID=UPI003528A192
MAQATPGWYPEADDPDTLRWWDGHQWTPQTTTRAALTQPGGAPGGIPPVPARPPLGDRWPMLAAATQITLALIMVVDLGLGALNATYVSTFRQWRDDPSTVDEEFGSFLDTAAVVLYLLWALLFIATAALFITWLFRGHRSDRMDPSRLQHASGWAIGGWFLPIVNLWRPLQMVRDLFRGAGVPTVPVVVGVWWGAFLVSGFVDRLSLALAPSDDLVGLDYIDASITSSGLDIASSALDLLAALLAIVVVRRATRAVRQDPPALEMPATTVL